jgi:hypothetical protein
MAVTYIKIASVAVGSGGAATIEFTSIPGTYTDLLLLSSTRDGTTADNNTEFKLRFNSSSTSWTNRYIQGNGSTVGTGSYATTYFYTGESDGNTATANTFGSSSIYIPQYAASTNKSVISDLVSEENTTVSYATISGGLWSDSSAITSIQITCNGTWAQYSTATLYGISKS